MLAVTMSWTKATKYKMHWTTTVLYIHSNTSTKLCGKARESCTRRETDKDDKINDRKASILLQSGLSTTTGWHNIYKSYSNAR